MQTTETRITITISRKTTLCMLNPGSYHLLGPAETIDVDINGASLMRFNDTFAYKRNEEPIHVHVAE